MTPAGPRLHVRGVRGYVDLAQATGDERFADLGVILTGGSGALAIAERAAEQDGRELADSEFGPAVPAPRVDYEGELGVVIGRGGRYIPAEDALAAIAGYVVVMDGTAREWQRAATQWTAGKNFDGSMPIGPEVVSTDEVDVSDVRLTTRLNGDVMQSASTAQMIFDVPRTIEFLSSFTTLRPGDVIATGTPGGVGFALQPPVWLAPGDVIEAEGQVLAEGTMDALRAREEVVEAYLVG
jgi:2-keto-4-pentenoate hydratase/2-oxohepta-3-ene-1,7-dioic acid hydratase in catechol pathway